MYIIHVKASASNRLVYYEKDITRKGFGFGTDRLAWRRKAAEDEKKNDKKMIQVNNTSHEYDRSMMDVCKLRFVFMRKEIIFLGFPVPLE